MKTIVADSSVLVKWVTRENEQDLVQSDQILKDVQNGKINIIAPELAKYEIGNSILKKSLQLWEAFHSLGTIYSSPVQFVPETEDLAATTYQIAQETRSASDKNFTYYDASFAALAKQENVVLVTANPKHQKKISGVKVLSLRDYKLPRT